ncbi:MAG TPA: hypothetical protein VME40_18570 [Caulobacteraceae bacterium]|nr:hypothetical protein [Caulobacteraceae bacterium]
MSPLAVVLALTLTPAPPPPPAAPPRLVERRLPAPCPDIDRGFVHYVAPPDGRGPLWPVEGLDPHHLDFGPALKATGPRTPPPMACPRLQPVAGR